MSDYTVHVLKSWDISLTPKTNRLETWLGLGLFLTCDDDDKQLLICSVLQQQQQLPVHIFLPLWSHSIPLLSWPRIVLSPFASFLEPSHGHYPDSPPPPTNPPASFDLQVEMNGWTQKWSDNTVVGTGAEAALTLGAFHADNIPFDPSDVHIFRHVSR